MQTVLDAVVEECTPATERKWQEARHGDSVN